MHPVEKYLSALVTVRTTAAASDELSFYGPLANLLDAVGSDLDPKVVFVANPKGVSESRPDGGFYTAVQLADAKDKNAETLLAIRKPEHGVIEIKGTGADLEKLAAFTFGQRGQTLGVRPSMGSRGDAYDNAMAESFFATLECELLAKHRFQSHVEARLAIFRYIEGWYNPHRRHSALGQRSPITFERQHAPTPYAA